jgi:hypothetical protein
VLEVEFQIIAFITHEQESAAALALAKIVALQTTHLYVVVVADTVFMMAEPTLSAQSHLPRADFQTSAVLTQVQAEALSFTVA